MSRTTVISRLAVATIGAVALVGTMTACGADEPKRDEPSGQITEASDADVFALQVGDCFNSADLEAEIEEVPVVPCGEMHDSEIYAEHKMAKGDYPGETVVDAKAEEFCEAEFATFFGSAVDEQDPEAEKLYAWWPLTPTSEGWKRLDDRVIQCVAAPYDESEQVTGSLKGVGAAAK